jgi:hypothetical protein
MLCLRPPLRQLSSKQWQLSRARLAAVLLLLLQQQQHLANSSSSSSRDSQQMRYKECYSS